MSLRDKKDVEFMRMRFILEEQLFEIEENETTEYSDFPGIPIKVTKVFRVGQNGMTPEETALTGDAVFHPWAWCMKTEQRPWPPTGKEEKT
jgi:hypothetical protein